MLGKNKPTLTSMVHKLKLIENDEERLEAAKSLAAKIVEESPDADLASKRLTNMRQFMRNELMDEEFIKKTRLPKVTIAGEKLRNNAGRLRNTQPIVIPTIFRLEKVADRISRLPAEMCSILDVCDIMIALSLRPIEVMNLHVTEQGCTGYAKGKTDEPRQFVSFCLDDYKRAEELLEWVRRNIQMHPSLNPAGAGGKKAFTKFLHSIAEESNTTPLKISYLRKIGSTYVGRVYGTGTIGSSIGWMRLALRHSDANHPSSAEFYGSI